MAAGPIPVVAPSVDTSAFDPRAMLDACFGNEGTVKHMLSVFLSKTKVTSVEEALAAGDARMLRKHAHALKGALGYVYATQAVATVKRIETEAEAAGAMGGGWDDATRERLATSVAELRGEVEQVSMSIRAWMAMSDDA